MNASFKTLLIAGVAAVTLAACGGDNDYVAPPTGAVTPPVVPPVPPPPPPPPTGDDSPQGQAGAGFAAAFNRGSFEEPVDPMDGDIVALDKTAEPIDFPPDP